MNEVRRIAVVGIGNIVMGDDGVGVALARRLAKLPLPPHVEVIEGGTLGLELASLLTDKDVILFLDAISAEQEPGSVLRYEIADPADLHCVRRSAHDGGLEELLRFLVSHSPPPRVVLLGIVPAELGFLHIGPSPALERKLDQLETVVLAELWELMRPVAVRATG